MGVEGKKWDHFGHTGLEHIKINYTAYIENTLQRPLTHNTKIHTYNFTAASYTTTLQHTHIVQSAPPRPPGALR